VTYLITVPNALHTFIILTFDAFRSFVILFQGYKRKNEFIITQMPLSTTKTDFWRLVEEHNVHVIVMLNNVSESKVEHFFSVFYWEHT